MKNKISKKINGGSEIIGGFTLIEMLVVIAVVGILSAAVLASLGPARTKAKDSRIISALRQVQAVAESYYDGDYSGLSVANPAQMTTLASDITANQGTLTVSLSSDELNYAAEADLACGSTWYCVDSNGNAKQYGTDPDTTAGVCP
ncbi:MAG: type II secretion system protein [Patescibacteria group bacterium]